VKTIALLLYLKMSTAAAAAAPAAASTVARASAPRRLNYIGSKFQLLDWITSVMNAKTGLFGGGDGESEGDGGDAGSETVTIADIFAGTGIVSYHFRTKYGAKVISNDAELYSSVITHAFTCSVYSEKCKSVIAMLCTELEAKRYVVGAGGGAGVGFVTRNYSPYGENERMFFTVDNAQRIDYVRERLEELKVQGDGLSGDEYKFILASILITADNVSNVPAVYGCYLKKFKAKAVRAFILEPIHKHATPCIVGSRTYCSDVLSPAFLGDAAFAATDITYIDPPYNERQYSKNYFPLNIIAKSPKELASVSDAPVLKGKTGIPADCFISPFCKRGGGVCEAAFDTLFRNLKTKWIFLSYNSESIVPKEKMLEIMGRYGVASVEECDYKRFKSFKYNGDLEIKEYLFCLRKS
jgi:adenine-specific DNA-methyltransferase